MSLYLHYNKDVKVPGFGLRCLILYYLSTGILRYRRVYTIFKRIYFYFQNYLITFVG